MDKLPTESKILWQGKFLDGYMKIVSCDEAPEHIHFLITARDSEFHGIIQLTGGITVAANVDVILDTITVTYLAKQLAHKEQEIKNGNARLQ